MKIYFFPNSTRFLRSKVALLLGLTLCTPAFGQITSVKGWVIDKVTGDPVIGATIVRPDGKGEISNAYGQFDISLESFPVKLKISHIAYGVHEYTIDKKPEQPITIRIAEASKEIPEVLISANKFSELSAHREYSFWDFSISNGQIFLLGSIGNTDKGKRLWLAELSGDTLTSISINNYGYLFRDVLGNSQLVFKDSVFQLFQKNDSLCLLNPTSRDSFELLIKPIKARFGKNLVYQTYLNNQNGLHTYFYKGVDQRPYLLTVIRDSLEESRQIHEHIYGKGNYLLDLAQSESPGVRSEARRMIGNNKKTKNTVLNRQVQVPVFTQEDTLFIINLYKDSLLSYTPDGKFKKCIPIDFHKDSNPIGIKYKYLNYLEDALTHRIYVLENQNACLTINQLNLDNGKIDRSYRIPECSSILKLEVYGSTAYYLFVEKAYPHYVRLARYRL